MQVRNQKKCGVYMEVSSGIRQQVPITKKTNSKQVSFTGVKITPAAKGRVNATFTLPKKIENINGFPVIAATLIAIAKGTKEKIRAVMQRTPDGQFDTTLSLPSNKTFEYDYMVQDKFGKMKFPDYDQNINANKSSEVYTSAQREEVPEINTQEDAFNALAEIRLKQQGVNPKTNPIVFEGSKNKLYKNEKLKSPGITEQEIQKIYIPKMINKIKEEIKAAKAEKLSIYDLATLRIIEDKFC